MTESSRTERERSITWVVDATAPDCFVVDPGQMAEFEATLDILQAECTLGEFVERMAARDPEILQSIFGTDAVDEIRLMAEDGEIAEFDSPWSPEDISSYDLIPENRYFYNDTSVPEILADLYVDRTYDGEYRSIPVEQYTEVLERLRAGGIPFVERPGAVFRLLASVYGGDLR